MIAFREYPLRCAECRRESAEKGRLRRNRWPGLHRFPMAAYKHIVSMNCGCPIGFKYVGEATLVRQLCPDCLAGRP